jgi:hypothetical protein
MHRDIVRLGLGAMVLAVMLAGLGIAPASATLGLPWFTIDGGGTTASTGGVYALGGTTGQPDAGLLTGGVYQLQGGFWLGGAVASGIFEPPDSQENDAIVFRVLAGAPNPFLNETGIYLDLPQPRPVQIQVLDPSGRSIRRLCETALPAGHHRFVWDGCADDGSRAASGAYLLRVRAG